MSDSIRSASLGYPVSVEEIPGAAQRMCDRSAKRIAVEAVGTGFSPNAQVVVEVHELAHALVGIEMRDDDPKLTYAEEEVVVECVAYSVCSSLGLDTAGSSVPYMTSWSKGEEIGSAQASSSRLRRGCIRSPHRSTARC